MKGLTITLTFSKMVSLHDVYVDLLTEWKPSGETEQLLFEHAMELEKELRVKVAKEVQKPKIVLSVCAARAFWMLWKMMEISGVGQRTLVEGLVADADQYLKSPELKRAHLLKV